MARITKWKVEQLLIPPTASELKINSTKYSSLPKIQFVLNELFFATYIYQLFFKHLSHLSWTKSNYLALELAQSHADAFLGFENALLCNIF